MLNTILTILTFLIGLALGLLVIAILIGIYALLFVRDDPWGWGEIVEELRKEYPGKGW